MSKKPETRDLAWIQAKCDIDPETGCWNWTGALRTYRYGVTVINGKQIATHRLAWSLVNGSIPDGMCICHHCDNTCCCNPEHLFLGTHQDNVDDLHRKFGLVETALTPEQVAEIRRDPRSLRALARAYGVSHMTISNARAGRKRYADMAVAEHPTNDRL